MKVVKSESFYKKTGQDVQLLYYSLDVCRLPWARASASVIVTTFALLVFFGIDKKHPF